VMPFYSGPLMHFLSGVDICRAAGKVQFRSLLGRARQRHRNPGHPTPQLVCEPKVSYKISYFNVIKH
jgi:hypothetical protein